MKTISLWQPWASLIVIGAKLIETRSFQRSYRGPLLIHASKAKKPEGREVAALADKLGIELPPFDDLPFGAIVGRVDLVGIGRTEDVALMAAAGIPGVNWETEKHFGDYSENRFGWLLKDPMQFKTPIPAKGSLSLWEFGYDDLLEGVSRKAVYVGNEFKDYFGKGVEVDDDYSDPSAPCYKIRFGGENYWHGNMDDDDILFLENY